LTPSPIKLKPLPLKARSSVGEHRPDTAGVGGSNPPVPTISTLGDPRVFFFRSIIDTGIAGGYNGPFSDLPRARVAVYFF
jgi:hypothetical protein